VYTGAPVKLRGVRLFARRGDDHKTERLTIAGKKAEPTSTKKKKKKVRGKGKEKMKNRRLAMGVHFKGAEPLADSRTSNQKEGGKTKMQFKRTWPGKGFPHFVFAHRQPTEQGQSPKRKLKGGRRDNSNSTLKGGCSKKDHRESQGKIERKGGRRGKKA